MLNSMEELLSRTQMMQDNIKSLKKEMRDIENTIDVQKNKGINDQLFVLRKSVRIYSDATEKLENLRKSSWSWNDTVREKAREITKIGVYPYNSNIGDVYVDCLKQLSDIKQEVKNLLNIENRVEQLYANCCDLLSKLPSSAVEDLNVRVALLYLDAKQGPINFERELHKTKNEIELRKAFISQNEKLIQNIVQAEYDIAKLQETIIQVKQQIQDTQVLVSDTPFYHMDTQELTNWLTKIKSNLEQGKLQPAMAGYKFWSTLYQQTLETCEKNKSMAEQALEKRQELRGIFSALLTKKKDVKHEQEINALEVSLQNCLFGTVTNISQANEMLKSYRNILGVSK